MISITYFLYFSKWVAFELEIQFPFKTAKQQWEKENSISKWKSIPLYNNDSGHLCPFCPFHFLHYLINCISSFTYFCKEGAMLQPWWFSESAQNHEMSGPCSLFTIDMPWTGVFSHLPPRGISKVILRLRSGTARATPIDSYSLFASWKENVDEIRSGIKFTYIYI